MIEQNVFSIIFAIFLLFTVRDVFFGQANQQQQPQHPNIEPQISRHKHDIIGHLNDHPMVKIQYCQSCGYRQAYEQIREGLKKDFPSIIVEGEIHKPDYLRTQLANLIFIAKSSFFIMAYFRFDPFLYFNLQTPRFWFFVLDNRMSASVLVLLLSSSIEGGMMSTGAFEIFYNDMPIWSKIQSGRMPYYHEIVSTIRSHLNINTNKYI